MTDFETKFNVFMSYLTDKAIIKLAQKEQSAKVFRGALEHAKFNELPIQIDMSKSDIKVHKTRARTAYNIFVTQKTTEYQVTYKDIPAKDRKIKINNEWKEMSDESKRPYVDESDKLKAEMGTSKKKSPPYKTTTGYRIYLSENLNNVTTAEMESARQLIIDTPDTKNKKRVNETDAERRHRAETMREANLKLKACSIKWGNLNEIGQKPYKDQADKQNTIEKAAYDKLNPIPSVTNVKVELSETTV
jgi:hypothetical protein